MLPEIRGVFIIEITTDTKEVKERKIAAKQWDEMIILRKRTWRETRSNWTTLLSVSNLSYFSINPNFLPSEIHIPHLEIVFDIKEIIKSYSFFLMLM